LRGDLFYLTHVLECIARIERYCAAGEQAFLSEELIQDAVLRNLQMLRNRPDACLTTSKIGIRPLIGVVSRVSGM
jgi:hypothetical protein